MTYTQFVLAYLAAVVLFAVWLAVLLVASVRSHRQPPGG